jgi:hypothetical protein
VQIHLDPESSTSGPLGSSDDAVLLPAYHTQSGTPGHSAPLLPGSGGAPSRQLQPGYESLLGGSDGGGGGGGRDDGESLSREESLTALGQRCNAVDDVAQRASMYLVDRRTQERAAAYALSDSGARASSLGGEPPHTASRRASASKP